MASVEMASISARTYIIALIISHSGDVRLKGCSGYLIGFFFQFINFRNFDPAKCGRTPSLMMDTYYRDFHHL